MFCLSFSSLITDDTAFLSSSGVVGCELQWVEGPDEEFYELGDGMVDGSLSRNCCIGFFLHIVYGDADGF